MMLVCLYWLSSAKNYDDVTKLNSSIRHKYSSEGKSLLEPYFYGWWDYAISKARLLKV